MFKKKLKFRQNNLSKCKIKKKTQIFNNEIRFDGTRIEFFVCFCFVRKIKFYSLRNIFF